MRRRAFSLAELVPAAALWAGIAGLIGVAGALGSRSLADSHAASTLCLAAAALERELGSARAVLVPKSGLSARRLEWIDAEGEEWRAEIAGGGLVAEGPERRVLAAGVDLAVFHFREGTPPIARVFLAVGGRPVLTSVRVGVRL